MTLSKWVHVWARPRQWAWLGRGRAFKSLHRTQVSKALNRNLKEEGSLVLGASRCGLLAVCVLLRIKIMRPEGIEGAGHASALCISLGSKVAFSCPAWLQILVNEGSLTRLEVVRLLEACGQLTTTANAHAHRVSGVSQGLHSWVGRFERCEIMRNGQRVAPRRAFFSSSASLWDT